MRGWRLPAQELEARVEGIVRDIIFDSALVGRLVARSATDENARLRSAREAAVRNASNAEFLELVGRVDLAPVALYLDLDAVAPTQRPAIKASRIQVDALRKSAPFQLRKRGVEMKLVLADKPARHDDTLIRNIARSERWFEQVRAGRSFDETAATEGISKQRVQQIMDLAFLAPDLVRDVLDDKKPLGLTYD